jgi:acetyl esterase
MAYKHQGYDIEPGLLKLARLDLDTSKRWLIRAANAALRAAAALPGGTRAVRLERVKIPRRYGEALRADLYKPRAASGPLPCLVYLHGGGFYLEGLPAHRKLCQHYAEHAGCAVLYIYYTLALETPCPAALLDGEDALEWAMGAGGAAHGIDPARVGVGGDSAGGALAASLCLRRRELGAAPPRLQLLIWPATDDRMETPSMQRFTDTPVWSSDKSKWMWWHYLHHTIEQPKSDLEYGWRDALMQNLWWAAPARAESLRELPPAYIETAEYDPLRDEGVIYANRLRADGVAVELNETARTIHAFDLLYDHPLTQRSLVRRVAFLRAGFGVV